MTRGHCLDTAVSRVLAHFTLRYAVSFKPAFECVGAIQSVLDDLARHDVVFRANTANRS